MEFREFLRREESKNESLLDLAKGGWNTFAGGMTVADELLAKAMGDGTRGRGRSGLRQLGRGLKQLTIGDSPKPQARETSPQPTVQRSPQTSPAKEPNDPKPAPLVFTVGKEKNLPSGLENLVARYRAAKTKPEREILLATMSMKYPRWYDGQIRKARAKQSRSNKP
jgi:hypothetical protein